MSHPEPPSGSCQSYSYQSHIDGLRAIAVSGILVFHAVPHALPGGFIGVDIFFVISGYLISMGLYPAVSTSTFSFKEFYARRVRRLFPALILMCVVMWAVGWGILLADEYKAFGNNLVGGAFFFSNIQFWRESGYFDAAAETKPLLHLWSLGVEEQFYLIWPAALWMIHRTKLKYEGLLVTVFLLSFGANILTLKANPSAVFFLTPFRLWEFLIGAGLALAEFRSKRSFTQNRFTQYSREIASLAGVGILFGSMMWIHSSSFFPGWVALWPTFGTALTIWAGSHTCVGRGFLGSRPLVYIGLISYPLYLWHWPLITGLRLSTNGHPSSAAITCCMLVTFLLAAMTYAFVERPIRFGFTRGIRQRFFVPLAWCMVGVACLGIATQMTQGFIGRFPAFLQNLANFNYDNVEDWRITTCFLNPDQRGFDKRCVDPPQKGHSLVMLWGDSLAAHIYPGLKALQNSEPFRVAQFTGSLCPPFVDWTSDPLRPYCAENNNEAMASIEKDKPDIVLMSAAWIHYEDFLKPPMTVADLLENTVAMLRKKGVRHIIIIGPFPGWNDPLPKSLYQFFVTHRTLPDRMMFNQVDKVFEQDIRLSSIARELGVDYISATDALCTQDGCLTYTDNDLNHLTAFDNGHMTAFGSAYFVKAIRSKLPF